MDKAEIIVFDIDQTLTESKQAMDSEMARLLDGLLGYKKVGIISGAAFPQYKKQILDHLQTTPEKLTNLYLLPTNGATLYHFENGDWKQIYDYNLTEEEKAKIFKAFEETFVETGFKKEEKVYGVLIEDRISQVTFSGVGSEAPIDLKKKWDPDHSRRLVLVDVLKKKLPEFAASIGGTTSIDVTRKGIDKAFGMKELMKHLNYTPDQLFYVGDALFPGGNDYSIIPLGIPHASVQEGEVVATKKLIRNFLEGKK